MSTPASLRIGTLGSIIVLHIGLLYAMKGGVQPQTSAPAAVKEVVAAFIVPKPAPAPAPPEPPSTKQAPAVRKAPPRPKPAKPVRVRDSAPSPQAITEPPVAPAPAEPVEPAEPAAAPIAAAPPVAPASPAPTSPQPRTVTSGIEYIQQPQVEYPPVSRRIREEGKAVLRVLVNDKGRPERIELQKSSGSTRLDEAARQAVSRAVFKPFIEDGKPVAAYAIVPVRFQLDS